MKCQVFSEKPSESARQRCAAGNIIKNAGRLPTPWETPCGSIVFQELAEPVSILDKEVFVIERTDVDLSIFVVGDGAAGRGCRGRDRDDLANGIRDRGVSSEAVIESVESGEGVTETAELHAVIESGEGVAETAEIHAVTEAAEAVAVSERAETAEAVMVEGVSIGIDRNQPRNRDEDEKGSDLFHFCFSRFIMCFVLWFVFVTCCRSVCLRFASALTYQLTHCNLFLLYAVLIIFGKNRNREFKERDPFYSPGSK